MMQLDVACEMCERERNKKINGHRYITAKVVVHGVLQGRSGHRSSKYIRSYWYGVGYCTKKLERNFHASFRNDVQLARVHVQFIITIEGGGRHLYK